MICSILLCQKSQQEKDDEDLYDVEDSTNPKKDDIYSSNYFRYIVFFIELVLIYFAIKIAIKCTKSTSETLVHLILAILFPVPYLLLIISFNPCAFTTVNYGKTPEQLYMNKNYKPMLQCQSFISNDDLILQPINESLLKNAYIVPSNTPILTDYQNDTNKSMLNDYMNSLPNESILSDYQNSMPNISFLKK